MIPLPYFFKELGVRHNLFKEVGEFLWHLLGVFTGEIPTGCQGVIVHLDDLDPFFILEMEQNIFAHHQSVIRTGRLQGEQIMVLKKYPLSYFFFYLIQIILQQLEIFFEDVGGHAL